MSQAVATETREFPDVASLQVVAGELGRNLKVLEESLSLEVKQRGTTLVLKGEQRRIDAALSVIDALVKLARGGRHIGTALVGQAARVALNQPEANLVELYSDVIFSSKKGRSIFPRTPNQRHYINQIREKSVVFGVGPAGTGKTYLAMAMAISALLRNEVDRIVLCRPAVEAGEKLGYLPGDLVQKVDPYLRPLYDALHDMVDLGRVERLMERGIIEVAPLAFMRGRTLSNAYILLDEAQNTTREQMKMFLTRIGVGSHAIITGDVTQIDLPQHHRSGLVHALSILEEIEKIGVTRFDRNDVVRHGLVSEIIAAYERDTLRGRGE